MHANLAPSSVPRRMRRGFTLTEILVAVAILVVVIVATARIFGTVSKVTGAGEANADLLQTAQVIEKQIRADIARISRDGFIVIRNVEVPNNVNQIGGPDIGPLLNSALPATARLRCDQLVFFTDGTATSTQYAGSKGFVPSSSGGPPPKTADGSYQLPVLQATAARVYYGHSFQLRNADSGADPFLGGLENGQPLTPWTYTFPSDSDTKVTTVLWSTGASPSKIISASQPGARDWILARQSLLLANDLTPGLGFNSPLRYCRFDIQPKNSTAAIWPLATSPTGAGYDSGPLSSRVDIAASTMDVIHSFVDPKVQPNGKAWRWTGSSPTYDVVRGFSPWFNSTSWPSGAGAYNWPEQGSFPGQRSQILRAISGPGSNPLRYPRAERTPPRGGMSRPDQMLSNPALAFGCSSFTIDWTWENGTGRMERPNGNVIDPTPNPATVTDPYPPNFSGDEFVGLVLNDMQPHPWFGLLDNARSVAPLCSMPVYNGQCDDQNTPGCLGLPIYPYSIEGYNASTPANPEYTISGVSGSRVYEATFGFNETEPLMRGANLTNSPSLDRGYTPWPSALRFTFTLHDPQQRFPEGRTFQFVVELPKR